MGAGPKLAAAACGHQHQVGRASGRHAGTSVSRGIGGRCFLGQTCRCSGCCCTWLQRFCTPMGRIPSARHAYVCGGRRAWQQLPLGPQERACGTGRRAGTGAAKHDQSSAGMQPCANSPVAGSSRSRSGVCPCVSSCCRCHPGAAERECAPLGQIAPPGGHTPVQPMTLSAWLCTRTSWNHWAPVAISTAIGLLWQPYTATGSFSAWARGHDCCSSLAPCRAGTGQHQTLLTTLLPQLAELAGALEDCTVHTLHLSPATCQCVLPEAGRTCRSNRQQGNRARWAPRSAATPVFQHTPRGCCGAWRQIPRHAAPPNSAQARQNKQILNKQILNFQSTTTGYLWPGRSPRSSPRDRGDEAAQRSTTQRWKWRI